MKFTTAIVASALFASCAQAFPDYLQCASNSGPFNAGDDALALTGGKMSAHMNKDIVAGGNICTITVAASDNAPCDVVDVTVATTEAPAGSGKAGLKLIADSGKLADGGDGDCGAGKHTSDLSATFKFTLPASGDAKLHALCYSRGTGKSDMYTAEVQTVTVDTTKESKCGADNGSGASALSVVTGMALSAAAALRLA